MDTAQILDTLRKIPVLQNVPEGQLNWLIGEAQCRTVASGDFAFRAGDAVEHLIIVLSGSARLFVVQGGSQREVTRLKAGDITGLLPFSRLTHAQGYSQVIEEAELLELEREKIKTMIRTHYELTEALVHFMTSRVRSFTKEQQQNEKLLSLGRLSAGLAHELNNPASAIVRSATALKTHLQVMPADFKSVFQIKLSEADVDAISELIFSKIKGCDPDRLSLSERNDLEDDIAAWLEEQGMDDGYEIAENLIEFGFTLEDLEALAETLSESDRLPVLRWINNNLLTERMVVEIGEAADRIGGIIGAVKSYSHMDQAQERQAIQPKEGIKNTLMMLQHKLKEHQVQVNTDFEDEEAAFLGIPGQINQVWTNLIDNAIDAVRESAEPQLHIRTHTDSRYLRIEVADNGTGIPEDVRDKIFDPFFTTKKIGEGTGIGLDVVHQIVTENEGSIQVDSEPGKTVFTVCFPRVG